MKFRFSMNGEYVTRKTFEDCYGKTETRRIINELKNDPWATIYLNDGMDEVFAYNF